MDAYRNTTMAKPTLAGLPDEILDQILQMKLSSRGLEAEMGLKVLQRPRVPGQSNIIDGCSSRDSILALGRTSYRFVDATRKSLLRSVSYTPARSTGLVTFLEQCQPDDEREGGYGRYIKELEVKIKKVTTDDLLALLQHCSSLKMLDLRCTGEQLAYLAADSWFIAACRPLQELRLRVDDMLPAHQHVIGQLLSGSQLKRIWLGGFVREIEDSDDDPGHELRFSTVDINPLPRLRQICLWGDPCPVFSAIVNAATQPLKLTCVDSIPEMNDDVAARVKQLTLELDFTPRFENLGTLDDPFEFEVISVPKSIDTMKGIEEIHKMTGLIRLTTAEIGESTYRLLLPSIKWIEVVCDVNRQQPLLDFLADQSRSPALIYLVVTAIMPDNVEDPEDPAANDQWQALTEICQARDIVVSVVF